MVLLWQLMGLPLDLSQQGSEHAGGVHAATHPHTAHALLAWEGSPEGMAYSEFNHHVAGLLLMVIGSAEVAQALRVSWPLWARLLLPAALGLAGIFLLIWSDHDAWPIGSLTLSQTLLGGNYELLQHKVYGMVALLTASVEVVRRTGNVRHGAWMIPLPVFAVIGGWMLFSHSHGAHPAAETIALHHAIMGTLAITAGSSRLVSAWKAGAASSAQSRWELLWAGLICVIALQLIIYSE
jgi:hypothetical protein